MNGFSRVYTYTLYRRAEIFARARSLVASRRTRRAKRGVGLAELGLVIALMGTLMMLTQKLTMTTQATQKKVEQSADWGDTIAQLQNLVNDNKSCVGSLRSDSTNVPAVHVTGGVQNFEIRQFRFFSTDPGRLKSGGIVDTSSLGTSSIQAVGSITGTPPTGSILSGSLRIDSMTLTTEPSSVSARQFNATLTIRGSRMGASTTDIANGSANFSRRFQFYLLANQAGVIDECRAGITAAQMCNELGGTYRETPTDGNPPCLLPWTRVAGADVVTSRDLASSDQMIVNLVGVSNGAARPAAMFDASNATGSGVVRASSVILRRQNTPGAYQMVLSP